MKKISTLVAVLILSMTFACAQSSRIALSSYKQIEKANGKWGQWPSQWISYSSEGRSNPQIVITLLSTSPYYIYNLTYYIDGQEVADFEVIYDEDETSKMRKEWNTKYVNCYVDADGNYIYVQGTSLDQLSKDPNVWAKNQDTKLYMWVNSENFAVIVK